MGTGKEKKRRNTVKPRVKCLFKCITERCKRRMDRTRKRESLRDRWTDIKAPVPVSSVADGS